MGRTAGWRLPIWFFREVHWYDVRHGTSTAERVLVENFDVTPEKQEDSVIYMASWTSVIERVYHELRERVGQDFERLSVIDVGCGKGKFMCVWSDLLERDGFSQNVIGIDFSPAFIDMSQQNLRQRGHSSVQLVCADVAEFDILQLVEGEMFLYLYNPFSAMTLTSLLEHLKGRTAWIAYCNPENDEVILQAGFRLVCEWADWHRNQWVRLYRWPLG